MFLTTGTIGRFVFQTMLIQVDNNNNNNKHHPIAIALSNSHSIITSHVLQVITALGLVGIAASLTDFLMAYVLPQRSLYKQVANNQSSTNKGNPIFCYFSF
jgi:hypothetical protein